MALKHILGNIPVIRMIDFLIDHKGYDYIKPEIADGSHVGPADMKRDFQCLVKCGVVTETRKIGGVQLYRLNEDNNMTQSLIKFDEALTDYCTDKILETEASLDEVYGEPLPEPPED